MGNIASSFSSAPSSKSPEKYALSSSSAPSFESPEKYALSSSSAPSSEPPEKYVPSSSSAPSSEPPKKYDVFINFRGDTRNIFTRHLHDALCRNKIETYIDYRIEKGDEVWPALVEAIENSLLFLVIFSEHYASSTWCLKELDRILEVNQGQKRRVIPVFYNIEPTDVRKQTARSYGQAFSKYENSNHSHQVGKWKAALTTAANLEGWDSSSYSGNEVALIRDIVRCVLRKLNPLYQSSSLDGLVGIQEQIKKVEALLRIESQDVVRFIGIWGMGGIGKTKIAEELFNKLCCEFESSCFLANVREESEKHGIMQLKNKLFSKLLEDKESYMDMPDGITIYARTRLGKKKVLVVLDDVNDPEQLQKLTGEHNWFGLGSRVIITVKDKQIFGKNVNEIYEVTALEFQDALQLFYLNAFDNECFDEEFEELSWAVVEYAKGLPLVLKVLGSLLYGKAKEKWKSQLEKLKKMPCKQVQKIFKLSYEELDREEKIIFLGIACFLKGKRVQIIKSFFDACGCSTEIGFDRLQDKALITISHQEVSMHDLLQDTGREIFRENFSRDPGQPSWLWDANDIYQVLKYNKGTEAIKAISLDMSKIEELDLSPQVFAKMPSLKLLEIFCSKEPHLYLPQGIESLPNELRYLHWHRYPLKSLPLKFSLEKLVELHMPFSEMRKMWDGVQNLTNLKEMDLSHSRYLVELPDFSNALNLEIVRLSGCSSLSEVHPSILSLQNLEQLWLCYCDALTSLKSDVHLKSLDLLNLDKCSRLKEISITAENITSLYLTGTAIDGLPSCIGRMSKLHNFILHGSKNLKNIPINLFDGLHSLFWMFLYGCPKLQCLPELPPSLGLLYVDGCPSLETVTSVAHTKTKVQNCNNLSEHSIKAIQANLMVHINKSLSLLETCNRHRSRDILVKYPGSRVPEWFKYRTTHHPITIDLSSAPPSMDWGLIFCICHGETWNQIIIRCRLRIFDDQTVGQGDDNDADENYRDDALEYYPYEDYGPDGDRSDNYWLTSDHVQISYNEHFCHEIHQSIKKSRASSNSKIELVLDLFSPDVDDSVRLIEECGVCPTYESEYQNFMKQMGLESQASASRTQGDEWKEDYTLFDSESIRDKKRPRLDNN